ncbi:MAG: hypothetical protein Q8R87_01900, partial [Anaerolineaceae bacterium]|nr:hypothetical protein [Anaerolineaceae bacterium]
EAASSVAGGISNGRVEEQLMAGNIEQSCQPQGIQLLPEAEGKGGSVLSRIGCFPDGRRIGVVDA